jgi:threonylcarbamoyladenosine tRNA methylthiotransferase MtaB
MSTPLTVALHTLGCKLNFSETSSIRRQFERAGYAVTDAREEADVYVLNTCSVTDFADRKCRQWVRKVLRQNPQARVVVTGCYAQLKPEEIASIEGVDLVLGAGEKFRMLEYIDALPPHTEKGIVEVGELKELTTFNSAFSFGDRTRSFLKVQDGCDYKCSFCTIPKARGRSRSDTIEHILENVHSLAARGIKEIVLTGVNLGDFGNGTEVIEGIRPKKEALFIDLIRELDKVEEITRFRISSIEPNLCTDEIISFVSGSQRFAHHFHMPLQSGNDKQLKMMRRRYKRDLYASRVERIKNLMPEACIGVDVITGFPGETEEDFEETYRFIHGLEVSYLHVFTYSERPGTPAVMMDEVVPIHVRKQRNKRLRILSQKKKEAFYSSQEGKIEQLLIETQVQPGVWEGFTSNYVKTQVKTETRSGDLVQVRLGRMNEDLIVLASPKKLAIA